MTFGLCVGLAATALLAVVVVAIWRDCQQRKPRPADSLAVEDTLNEPAILAMIALVQQIDDLTRGSAVMNDMDVTVGFRHDIDVGSVAWECSRWNGSATVTIRINGGAADTQTSAFRDAQ